MQFIALPPIYAAEHIPYTLLTVWPSVNDALVSVLSGLLPAVTGLTGKRILQRKQTLQG